MKRSKMSANMAESALPYICKTCKKRFRQISHLQEHVILHTGRKPFLCPVCHRPFPRRSQLRIHHHLCHALLLYKCRQCHASFVQQSQLQSHILREHYISIQHRVRLQHTPTNSKPDRQTTNINGLYHAKCITNGIIHKSRHRGKRKAGIDGLSKDPLNMPLQSMTVTDWTDLCNSHTDTNDNVTLGMDGKNAGGHHTDDLGSPESGSKLTNRYTMLLENGGCDSMDGLGKPRNDLISSSPPGHNVDDCDMKESNLSPDFRSSQVTGIKGSCKPGVTIEDAKNIKMDVDNCDNVSDERMKLCNAVIDSSPLKPGPIDDSCWVASSPLRADGLLNSSQDPTMDNDPKLTRRGSSESLMTLVSSSQSEEMPDDLSRHGDPPVDPPDDLSRHGDEEHGLMLELDVRSEMQSDDEGPPALELMSGDDDPGSPPTLTKMCDSSVHRLHKLTDAVDCPESQAAGISPQYLTSREEATSIGHGSPPSDVDSKTSQIGTQPGTQYTSFFNEFAKFVNQLASEGKAEPPTGEKGEQAPAMEKVPTLRVVLKPVKPTHKRKSSRKDRSNRNVFSIFSADGAALPDNDGKKPSSRPRRDRRAPKHYGSDTNCEGDNYDGDSGGDESKTRHSDRPRRVRRKHYTCSILGDDDDDEEDDDDEDFCVKLSSQDKELSNTNRPQRTRRLPKHYMCECCVHSGQDSVRKHRVSAKRLHTQVQAVERLRHRVCVLFDALFTQLPYPPRFSNNTHAVESLLNQIIIAATDQDNGLGYPSNDVSSAVSVIVCKSPRQCLQQLRKKTVQLIKTLLPSLELNPEFDVCSEDVDHLLEEVIVSNSVFANSTA